MPTPTGKTKGGGGKQPFAALGIVTFCALLTGCVEGGLPGVSMFSGSNPSEPAAMGTDSGEISRAAGDKDDRGEKRSAIIDDLVARKSVLQPGTAYAQIGSAVLAANKGTAAAELRVARLKAEAKSKNWLPSIGPSVDLTSLGALAASILVEQVLFDNGKRKAERAFAAADVEIAAITLSDEMNTRVYEGLSHYIAAQRGRELSALANTATGRMQGYGSIMRRRVDGGLSDRSDERVILQKIAEMQATAAADRDAAITAMAELNAMTQVPVKSVSGISNLAKPSGPSQPLSVLMATGQGRRMIAEAKMNRAGFLPGLKASGNVGKGGLTGGLRLDTENGIGFGTGSSLKALEATEQVAAQKTESARDDADRKIVALDRQIVTLTAKQAEGANVLRQTADSLNLFTKQYKFGRRPLMELVGMYETYARLEREQTALKYDVALLQLQIAKLRGVLVDGARM